MYVPKIIVLCIVKLCRTAKEILVSISKAPEDPSLFGNRFYFDDFRIFFSF